MMRLSGTRSDADLCSDMFALLGGSEEHALSRQDLGLLIDAQPEGGMLRDGLCRDVAAFFVGGGGDDAADDTKADETGFARLLADWEVRELFENLKAVCLRRLYADLCSGGGGGSKGLDAAQLRACVECMGTHSLSGEEVRALFAQTDDDAATAAAASSSGSARYVGFAEFRTLAEALGRGMTAAALVALFRTARRRCEGEMERQIQEWSEGKKRRAADAQQRQEGGAADGVADERLRRQLDTAEQALSEKCVALCSLEEALKQQRAEAAVLRKRNRLLEQQLTKRAASKPAESEAEAAAAAAVAQKAAATRDAALLKNALEVRTGEVELLQNSTVQLSRFIRSAKFLDLVAKVSATGGGGGGSGVNPQVFASLSKCMTDIVRHATATAEHDASVFVGNTSIAAALVAVNPKLQPQRKNFSVHPQMLSALLASVAAAPPLTPAGAAAKKEKPAAASGSAGEPSGRLLNVENVASMTSMGSETALSVSAASAAAQPPPAQPARCPTQPVQRAGATEDARVAALTQQLADLKGQLSQAQQALVAGAGATTQTDLKLHMARRQISGMIDKTVQQQQQQQRRPSMSPQATHPAPAFSASPNARATTPVPPSQQARMRSQSASPANLFTCAQPQPVDMPVFSPQHQQHSRAASRSLTPGAHGMAPRSPSALYRGSHPDLSAAPESVRKTILQALGSPGPSAGGTPLRSPSHARSPSAYNSFPDKVAPPPYNQFTRHV